MNNFEFYNPTRIIFGKGTIKRLKSLVPPDATILMCYGGGRSKAMGSMNR